MIQKDQIMKINNNISHYNTKPLILNRCHSSGRTLKLKSSQMFIN